MSFELPDLDTQSAAQIEAQLIRRIPQFTSRWTDFNASDPGITLLQLLSWLGESLTYQADVIPMQAVRNMLRWVLGLPTADAPWPYALAARTQYDGAFLALQALPTRIERGARPSIDDLQAAVLTYLRTPYSAVTLPDVAALAVQANAMIDAKHALLPVTPPTARVARADAVVRGDRTLVYILSDAAPTYARPTAGNGVTADGLWQATLVRVATLPTKAEEALVTAVETYLTPRTLLGDAISVRQAQRTDITVTAYLRVPAAVQPAVVLAAVLEALARYFDPDPASPHAGRWHYDEAPVASAVCERIAGVPGVRAVETCDIAFSPSIRLRAARLGVDSLLSSLPPGQPALRFAGLPRLRAVSLLAAKDRS